MGKAYYDYTEGKQVPERPFLKDECYDNSIRVNPNPCTDCLIVNREKKTALFPIRKAKTGSGFWFIGGVWKAQLQAKENIQAVFERETSLKIDQARFKLIDFKNEDGLPIQTLWPTGRHDMHFFFAVELSNEETKQVVANLDPQEYEVEKGLQEFTLEELNEMVDKGEVREIVRDCFREAVK